MIDLGHGLRIIHDDELRLLARYHVEEYVKLQQGIPTDTTYLSPGKLSGIVGKGARAVREAIKARHYGQYDEQTGRCHATVTETRAYHFGGKQQEQTKKALARSKSLYKP